MKNIKKIENSLNPPVMVMSTDSYSDVWNVFFYYFKIFWADDKMKVYLITENLRPNIENIEVLNSEKDSWSGVLIDALLQVSDDYIVLILDDMFITDYVDKKQVKNAMNFISTNDSVGCVRLGGNDRTRVLSSSSYKNVHLVDKKSPYRVTTSPSIWDRRHLIEILSNGESPWEFESKGTERASKYSEEYYNLTKDAIVTFNTWVADSAIIRGKWQYHAIKMLKRDNQLIDFSQRGVATKTLPLLSPLLFLKRFFINFLR